MTEKEPVLLIVLIETARLRWYVAGMNLKSRAFPLLRSEEDNLDSYLGLPFDEQVSFLRHRLSGVLQRGCDRLWGRQMKPCQIVFLADGPFTQAAPELTTRVAEHFVQWMTRPPVVYCICQQGFGDGATPALKQVAGEIDSQYLRSLSDGLPELLDRLPEVDVWELSPTKRQNRVQS
jgi:hypothetical protein